MSNQLTPKQVAAAIEFNRHRAALGHPNDRHLALLVARLQRELGLAVDGKLGDVTEPRLVAAVADLVEPAPPRSYPARATGYYPPPPGGYSSAAEARLEGGADDRIPGGELLHTLQDYLEGKAPFVSLAMDSHAFTYGTRLQIPELDAHFRPGGPPIDFRVVDTGDAFKGKGTTRVDVCCRGRRNAEDAAINRRVTLVVV